MLSTMKKVILKNNFNKMMINNFDKFNFASKDDKIKEEQKLNEIHNYIKTFKGNKFERTKDELLVTNKLVGKVSSFTGKYLVFKSNLGYRIIKVLLLQLVMTIPCLLLLYYSIKGTYKEYQFNQYAKMEGKIMSRNYGLYGYSSLVILSIFFLDLLRRNNLYKIWKYVKIIELSKDLKKLEITTFLNKTINTDLKNVYLYYNFSSPYVSPTSFNKVEDTLVIGVENKILMIPLEKSTIQSKDLLSICVRGYSMKLNKEI